MLWRFMAYAAALSAGCAHAVEIRPLTLASESLFNRTASGSFGSFPWQARSLLVGQTSTATPAAGGDPIYMPSRPGKDGLAFLEIEFGSLGFGYCSGSLMAGGAAILTAAHCVADSSGNIAATGGFAYFYPGPADPFYDLDFGFVPGIQRVPLSTVHVAPGYTGSVIDHNDLAIIFLGGAAPGFAVEYLLDALPDPTGIEFNIAGFGDRGPSGATGAIFFFGRLREGDNRFDFRLGDPDFGGGWSIILGEPLAQISDSWVSDFDRVGFAANDTACLVAADPFFGLSGPKYCNTGIGPREVGAAGGDSGGPQFVGGKIVSVTSYGLSFGRAYGDVDNSLNSTWGEFTGYAPVFRNAAWIRRLVPGAFGPVPTPAPATLTLLGIGLGLLVLRRRRS